jgi:15-cis-phytoene synthase
MIDRTDMQYCVEAIRHGSRSFHAASKLLPREIREPALVLYAFCRLADDAVDLRRAKTDAVLQLHDRLDLVYKGQPRNAPEDRAFCALVEAFQMPRRLPEALLEGLAWDAMERQYADLSELRAYSARVASAVGAMMCVLMRVRDRDALARACDLGVAMQLTNIARDVGEDARAGRLYLPIQWMEEVDLDPARFMRNPKMSDTIGLLINRLLREADALYWRSEAGIRNLPPGCRPGIFAARYIYAGIGGQLRRMNCNAIDFRARTKGWQKLGWLLLSVMRSGSVSVMPRSPVLYAHALPETGFLVEAAADRAARDPGWSDRIFQTLADLKSRDNRRQAELLTSSNTASKPI